MLAHVLDPSKPKQAASIAPHRSQVMATVLPFAGERGSRDTALAVDSTSIRTARGERYIRTATYITGVALPGMVSVQDDPMRGNSGTNGGACFVHGARPQVLERVAALILGQTRCRCRYGDGLRVVAGVK